MSTFRRRLRVPALLALAIVLFSATTPIASLRWVRSAEAERAQVEDRIDTVRRAEKLLTDAESAQRGFVITGQQEFLQPYYAARSELEQQMAELERGYLDATVQEQQLVADMVRQAREKLDFVNEQIHLRTDKGQQVAAESVASRRGVMIMDGVRKAALALVAAGQTRLSDIDDHLTTKVAISIGVTGLSTMLIVGLVGWMTRFLLHSLQRSEQAIADKEAGQQALQRSMEELARRNREVVVLAELSRVLQTALSVDETLRVVEAACRELIPGSHGALYLLQEDKAALRRLHRWGDAAGCAASVESQGCWAIRRGTVHRHGAHGLQCGHLPADAGRASMCLPLVALGETLGLLHLQAPEGTQEGELRTEQQMALAQTISEQAALSLANAQLRENLRQQSIRDPLTGMHNRRYFDETLVREMARASRHGAPVTALVVDLDHFKRINDTHGHQAGDEALKYTARLLGGQLRDSDVACRIGGEEFVLLLPECGHAHGVAKAQQLADALRALDVRVDGKRIRLTASIGVATFPDDASDGVGLIAAADAAVYAAKAQGRDRVVSAHGLNPAPSVPAATAATPEETVRV